jgi:hypothetical protein
MPTRKNSLRSKGTRRRHSGSTNMSAFQKEITVIFLEMLMMVKLFHWKTHSYATHKATDELHEKLNGHIDRFIEVLLGKTGSRIDLMGHKTIRLMDLSNQSNLISEIERFKSYLVGMENIKALQTMSNNDLYNIRDEILGDLNQFLYLLTFK